MKFLIAKFLLPVIFIFACYASSCAQTSSDAGEKIALDLTDDSVSVYRKDKDFAYVQYLDSLLRATSNLTVDTISLHPTGASKRGKKSNSNSLSVAPRQSIFSNGIVKILLWGVAIFFVSFVLYKLFFADTLFRKEPAPFISDKAQEEESVSDASGYDKKISQAVSDKNFRLAVRFLFLQTLQILGERGLLQFSPEKTNDQFVNELINQPFYQDFAAITLHYEYVWYGKFNITETFYKKLSGYFKTFHQKL